MIFLCQQNKTMKNYCSDYKLGCQRSEDLCGETPIIECIKMLLKSCITYTSSFDSEIRSNYKFSA